MAGMRLANALVYLLFAGHSVLLLILFLCSGYFYMNIYWSVIVYYSISIGSYRIGQESSTTVD